MTGAAALAGTFWARRLRPLVRVTRLVHDGDGLPLHHLQLWIPASAAWVFMDIPPTHR
jgi:hypothetical protein